MRTKDELIEILQRLHDEGEDVRATSHEGYMIGTVISRGKFDAWRNKIIAFCDNINFVPEDITQSIKKEDNYHPSDIDSIQEQLKTLMDLIRNGYIEITSVSNASSETMLENLFGRFHKVARQLRTRHAGRSTLSITDEYDVQDLLHALLLIHFDDVRAEEWTPSYAGSCVRMDFLLKAIQTVIEVKKTRPSMTAKTLGEELIIDIEKYKAHPDCKQIYCFVYDPEGHLGNPVGIKRDLEAAHPDYLKVFIMPE